jgi:hypothetical protein
MLLLTTVVSLFVAMIIAMTSWAKKKQEQQKKQLISLWGQPKQNHWIDVELVGKQFLRKIKEQSFFHVITDAIVDDLDLHEVFTFLDRTTSKIGQQYLYCQIRTINTVQQLLDFNRGVSLFEQDKELAIACQGLLKRLDTYKSYYLEELLSEATPVRPKHFWLMYLSPLAVLISLGLGIIHTSFFLLILPVFIINTWIHYRNKSRVGSYLSSISVLGQAVDVARALAQKEVIQKHFGNASFINPITIVQKKARFLRIESSLDNELMTLVWAFFEFLKIMFNLEIFFFYGLLESLSSHQKSLRQLIDFIGKIDASIAVASLRGGGLPTCMPSFTSPKVVKIRGLIHPLIPNCIPNDLTLDGTSVLLTGSNMSGKTTFIRTLAINNLLAQTIYCCFAEQFESPFMKLFSSIRVSDSLADKTSYYLEEIRIIQTFIDASEEKTPCLFIMDELLKGTNTIERVATAKAILSYLNKSNHLVFVATHDLELVKLLAEEHYDLYHFCESIGQEGVTFDHLLKKGALTEKNAIKLLERNGYPQQIIEEAKRLEQLLSSE